MYSVKLEGRSDAKLRIVWLHGWGTDHDSLISLAMQFQNQAENYLVDLPGFGQTHKPEKAYGSENYADVVADFIKLLPPKKTIVIGHSNGGRVIISLISKYKHIVDGAVLIAGAGIPLRRGIFFKTYSWIIRTFSPTVKKIFPFLKNVSLSSADYRNSSGVMKETFLKIIKEDLREKAKEIEIPVLLIYGDLDRDTPAYFGEEYNKSIKNSQLNIISGATHWGLILEYKTKVHHIITNFIRKNLC